MCLAEREAAERVLGSSTVRPVPLLAALPARVRVAAKVPAEMKHGCLCGLLGLLSPTVGNRAGYLAGLRLSAARQGTTDRRSGWVAAGAAVLAVATHAPHAALHPPDAPTPKRESTRAASSSCATAPERMADLLWATPLLQRFHTFVDIWDVELATLVPLGKQGLPKGSVSSERPAQRGWRDGNRLQTSAIAVLGTHKSSTIPVQQVSFLAHGQLTPLGCA